MLSLWLIRERLHIDKISIMAIYSSKSQNLCFFCLEVERNSKIDRESHLNTAEGAAISLTFEITLTLCHIKSHARPCYSRRTIYFIL